MLLPTLLILGIWFSSACAKNCTNLTPHSRTRAPRRALVVDSSGSMGDSFPTISKAVDALSKDTVGEQVIFVHPGVYKEQVYIPPLLGPLTIQGYTCDRRYHALNQVALTNNTSRRSPNITDSDQTGTLRVWSTRVKLYNLNITNDYGPAFLKGQAVALSAQATDLGVYACSLKGWEDTVYANVGRQLYSHTYINGAVDFIIGIKGVAWFQNCQVVSVGDGHIASNGRNSVENPSWFVFHQCYISGTRNASTYLGRPWGEYSRVVYQYCRLGNVVHPKGWTSRGFRQSTDNLYLGEFDNKGEGAFRQWAENPRGVSKRARFTVEMDIGLRLISLFGRYYRQEESWVDLTFIPDSA
ncbi:hypothetical protein QQZ08_006881 [Neonectria magnoliae]|uniref:pectinesterase n=1 Tax=Neonectria magnoliae TaxID=2732573 RepID=A0ABR1HZM9_9HYPO